MSSFISQLRQGSFRGVSFDVPQDEVSFGRRVVTEEFPGRDEPGHEDLGASVRVFTITAVVGGNRSFLSTAAALEAALTKSGPGTLIHPHYGELDVIVKDARREHSSTRVGDVNFSITFEKYGKPLAPLAASDTLAGLSFASGNLLKALEADFKSRFIISSIPDFVSSDGLMRITSLVSTLSSGLSAGGFASLLSGILPSWASLLPSLSDDVTHLFDNLVSLVKPKRKPAVGAAPAAPAATAVPLMRVLAPIVATPTPATFGFSTSQLPRREQNAQAIDGLFRGAAAAAICSAARYAQYESREQAVAVRGQVFDAVTLLRDDFGSRQWDASWQATGSVLAAISRDINVRLGRLPRTVRVKTYAVRSSLALANRLYGDDTAVIFTRGEDVVRRNGVRHPGFVPAKELEVLIDVA